MLSRLAWMVPTAFTMLFLIGAQAFQLQILVLPAGICFVATLYVLYRDFKPRDKYDLKALEDFEDKVELSKLDPNVGVFEFDLYLCPYCKSKYSSELRNCPKCGRARARY